MHATALRVQFWFSAQSGFYRVMLTWSMEHGWVRGVTEREARGRARVNGNGQRRAPHCTPQYRYMQYR